MFHGSRGVDGVYLKNEMRSLTEHYPHFNYTACISGGDVPGGFTAGRAADVALMRHPQLKAWRIYLCGNSEMVKAAKRKAFLAGAALNNIHADPFEFSHRISQTPAETSAAPSV